MKSWTMILCEGAHDQQFVSALARVCGNWEQVEPIPDSLPRRLRNSFPQFKLRFSKGGFLDVERVPVYLRKGECYLEIRALGGVDLVLGYQVIALVEQSEPDAVGAIVDSNDVGVEPRVQSFRKSFGRVNPKVKNAKAGEVVPGTPRIGIWVAPNNKDKGRLDDIVLSAVNRSEEDLVDRGREFVDSLEWIRRKELAGKKTKAILGAISQIDYPGTSLAVSISKSDGWLEAEVCQKTPFKRLLRFIEELARAES